MTTSDLEAWRNYRQTRDPAVRDALIEKHLVLVKYAAARSELKTSSSCSETAWARRIARPDGLSATA